MPRRKQLTFKIKDLRCAQYLIAELSQLPQLTNFDMTSIEISIKENKRKHSVNHVFSSPTSIINFTSKKPSYDDTRRSGRDNELLQRAQNDL